MIQLYNNNICGGEKMDKDIKQMFELVLQKLENVEESQKNMEKRLDEIFSVAKAIEHSNTTHRAEIDNLTYKIAHTEGTVNKMGDVIIERKAIK